MHIFYLLYCIIFFLIHFYTYKLLDNNIFNKHPYIFPLFIFYLLIHNFINGFGIHNMLFKYNLSYIAN